MLKKSTLMISVMAWIIIGSACTPALRYVPQPLPLPARPVLPAVTAEDLAPLSAAAYSKIEKRDRLRRQYAEDLETIIRTNNKQTNNKQ